MQRTPKSWSANDKSKMTEAGSGAKLLGHEGLKLRLSKQLGVFWPLELYESHWKKKATKAAVKQ